MIFNEKIERAVARHHMLDGAKKVIVAFSGGADSSALLWWLCANAERYGVAVEAFHLNHGVRGESADRDELFCRESCTRTGVYFESARLDIPSLAREWGCGEEEAGRRARYTALEEMAQRRGADRIATAHHADDNLETVIFNLARGTGPRGVGGIPPVRGRFIRPLIYCTRDEIEAAVRENGIPFTEDETNQSDGYSRNFIRHNIVPALKKLNPRAAEAVSRAAELARADDEWLTLEASELLERAAGAASVPGRYACATVAIHHSAVSDRAVALAAGDAEQADARGEFNLRAAAEAIARGADTRVSVGRGLALDIYRGSFAFVPDRRDGAPAEYEFALTPGVPAALPTGMTAALFTDRDEMEKLKKIHPGFICTSLDGDIIASGITVRSRRPGDRLRVRGVSRTVKNLMQEAGVPAGERDALPVFCAGGAPVWIPRAVKGQTRGGVFLVVW